MKYLPLCLLPLLIVSLSGCDSVDSNATDDLIVVEAFLYAHEPVTDIRLVKAIPLSSEDTVATPINDATVRLVKNGVSYTLAPAGADGFYAYPGDDLSVETGDVFRLEVEGAGQRITSETTVPPPPEGLALSDQILEAPTFDFPGSGGPGGPGVPGRIQDNTLTVTWENPSNLLHYVVIESLSTGEPEYILPDFVRERFTGFRLVTRPTDINFFDIRVGVLEVFGPHRAIVYRVNREYADLYENREQDSRDLNEPPTNIEGGLGVFSAFNSRSIPFDVVSADE